MMYNNFSLLMQVKKNYFKYYSLQLIMLFLVCIMKSIQITKASILEVRTVTNLAHIYILTLWLQVANKGSWPPCG